MIDWILYIKERMPEVMRRSKVLTLLRTATGKTTGDGTEAERYAEKMKGETMVIGQQEPMMQYLDGKYGSGITMEDVSDGWTVPLFGPDRNKTACLDAKHGMTYDVNGKALYAVTITSVAKTEMWDLMVKVPAGMDASAVESDVRKRLFAGLRAKTYTTD